MTGQVQFRESKQMAGGFAGLSLKFQLNQVQSCQTEASVFANSNVANIKYLKKKGHTAPTVCALTKLLHL
jgi:hypothetical protein